MKSSIKITISKKSYNHLLEAWAKMNILCSYYENTSDFTKKYNPKQKALEMYKHLDYVVSKLPG